MATFTDGMNVDAVSASSTKLSGYQRELQGVSTDLTALVTRLGSAWHGDDAAQFGSNWKTRKVTVDNAAEVIGAMARKAGDNVEAQRTASAS